ncbi:MAG: aminopeptidase [Acidobacteriota bacterium]|jgi:leucyl aminopeptidase (aminopeptidase T)
MRHRDLTLHACRHALRHNLGLAAGESVLVVTDALRKRIGEAFAESARELTPDVGVDVIPVGERNGAEPPRSTALKMAAADVALLVTEQSLSWTNARKTATDRGTRVASMPRLDESTLCRTLTIDYEIVRNRVNRVCDQLDRTARVRVTTSSGTDLTFSIEGRRAHGRKGGIYRGPGQWGNLPCGEAFVAPVEGSGRGVYVVDASHAGVGKLAEPIRIRVEDGRAVRIEGGREAARLRRLLRSVGESEAYQLAEFGIGCNHAARICGITLEDEKVLGTCHLALGRNDLFGGTVHASVHVDGVLTDPTVLLDGEKLSIDEGGPGPASR